MKPVQIPSSMSIGTTVIELREFKEKKNNMGKILFLALIGRGSKYFSEMFVLTCSMV